MKKRWIRPAPLILCAALLLAGCGNGEAPNAAPADPLESAGIGAGTPAETAPGGETAPETAAPGEEYFGPPLEKLRASNTLDAVLEHHTAASYREEAFLGERQELPLSASEGRYYRDVDGYLRVDIIYDSLGEKRYVEGFADQNFAGARYELTDVDDVDDAGGKSMCIFPSGEYEAFMSALWVGETIAMETETPVDCYPQDGRVVVTSLTTYPPPADSYLRTMYILESEHGHLLYRETYTYLLEEGQQIPNVPYGEDDNEVAYVVRTTVSYDELRELGEIAPHEEVIGRHSDYCELSVIEGYGSDEPVVRWYPVAHGTDLLFLSLEEDAYRLYTDAELTREINFLGELDTGGETANLFLVKRQAD